MTFQDFLKNWKTTASSILTVTLTTSAALMAYPPVAQHLKVMGALGLIQVVGKVWIGLIQKDANGGTQ